MNEQEWTEQLQKEGFTDIRVCPLPPNQDSPQHTHDQHTVHVIMNGQLSITDGNSTKIYEPGSRIEFPAGTTHTAKGSTDDGSMIVGVKEA